MARRGALKSAGNAVMGALAVVLLKFLRLFPPDRLSDFAGWLMRTMSSTSKGSSSEG